MFYLVIATEGQDRSIWVFKVLHADSISSMSSMAEPQKKTHKTSRFLACFGFSGKKNSPKKPIQTGSKNTPSLSFPMLCFRPGKSRTKTVPVDNSDKTDTGGENHTPSKLSKNKSYIKLIPSRQNSKPDRQLSFPNQASRTRPNEVLFFKLNLALITSVAGKKAIHVVSYNFLSLFCFYCFAGTWTEYSPREQETFGPDKNRFKPAGFTDSQAQNQPENTVQVIPHGFVTGPRRQPTCGESPETWSGQFKTAPTEKQWGDRKIGLRHGFVHYNGDFGNNVSLGSIMCHPLYLGLVLFSVSLSNH